jgi:hypothetical protein
MGTAGVVPRRSRMDEAEHEGRGSGAGGGSEGMGFAYEVSRS